MDNKYSDQCKERIISEDYMDLIINLDEHGNKESVIEDNCYMEIGKSIVVYFRKIDQCGVGMKSPYINEVYYGQIPFLFSMNGLIESNISDKAKDYLGPNYGETGEGVLFGILGSGINYQHQAFINNGKTKIEEIWDQTLVGKTPSNFPYGAIYTREEINKALESKDPESIVPTKDENGLGSMLAGLAVGTKDSSNNFQGVAPDAHIIAVKIKPAKKCLSSFFEVPEGVITYQETDLIFGISYLVERANYLKKPIVILVPFESNAGPHNGSSLLELTLARYGDGQGVVVIVTGGNEAAHKHHYKGEFPQLNKNNDQIQNVNINVLEENFDINMFNFMPDILTIEVITPSGESTGKVRFVTNKWNEFKFQKNIRVIIHYVLYEEYSGDQVTHIHVYNAEKGLWTINVYGEEIIVGRFDMWVLDYSENGNKLNVEFLKPDPYTTVTIPSTNHKTITAGAYNTVYDSMLVSSGRGNTRNYRNKPDLVAPGVNLLAPFIDSKASYRLITGSSAGAAVVAGGCLLLLSYEYKKKEEIRLYINTITMRTYLIRGAKRNKIRNYPNRLWGYGELDIEGSFIALEKATGRRGLNGR